MRGRPDARDRNVIGATLRVSPLTNLNELFETSAGDQTEKITIHRAPKKPTQPTDRRTNIIISWFPMGVEKKQKKKHARTSIMKYYHVVTVCD